MGRHRLAGLAGALPLMIVLAACSGAAATPSPTAAPPSVAPSVAAPSAAASPSTAASAAASPSEAASGSASAESYEIKVATATVNGASATFLTGEDGKTLYVFKKDTANSGKSACGPGPCLDNWPPFKVEDASQLKADSGVTGKLDVITRDDGSKQVTYNGMPLYYFAGDTAAGTENGASIPNWALATP